MMAMLALLPVMSLAVYGDGNELEHGGVGGDCGGTHFSRHCRKNTPKCFSFVVVFSSSKLCFFLGQFLYQCIGYDLVVWPLKLYFMSYLLPLLPQEEAFPAI